MTDLGKILKQRRVTNRLTLQKLGATSGVSASHLARIERGERFPSGHILRKIAKPLGFEESELLTLGGYLSPQSPTAENETHIGKLDPYVASVLASEPVATQRAVIGILSILKSIANGKHESNTGFAEYVRKRYPGIDEDLITMIENILEHPPKGKWNIC